MKILAVDDDAVSLETVENAVRSAAPENEIYGFDSALAALAKAREERIDVAFLDIRMPELSGIDLGRYLRELNPYTNLIYVSEHKEFGCEVMALRASGYLEKPASKQKVREELDALRFPDQSKGRKRAFGKSLYIFEVNLLFFLRISP